MYIRHRYAVLFYSLLLTMVGVPIVRALGLTGNLLQVFVGLNLLAAAAPLESRKGHWVLPVILLAAVLSRVGSVQIGHSGLSTASLVLWILIALYAVFRALRLVLRSSTITFEHLYAALSAYLLAGVFLGVLYWSMEEAWPGSVAVSGPAASRPFHLAEGIYFSFITLATVGYGDMVPGNDIVRGLAVVEAIAGQFYLAVMIARLMSLYMREVH
ncbi:MAG TPA: ion channel [Nitrospira sp.]|nr:ion channel [Nitrospira sp.]